MLPAALGIATWRGAVGDDAPKAVSMPGNKPIQRVGHRATHDAVTHRRPVAPHEPPARLALVFGEDVEQSGRRRIVERQEREAPPAVDSDDDTRRPPAEASARVVEEDGSWDAHVDGT